MENFDRQEWRRYRRLDRAVLYLRIFAGAALLLRNIGKIQLYNELITSYPTVFHLPPAAVFVVVSVAEVVLAVLLVAGAWVRWAAAILIGGVLLQFLFSPASLSPEAGVAWIGIYLFLFFSGGGLYAFDRTVGTPKAGN